jgi:hypothetical protein
MILLDQIVTALSNSLDTPFSNITIINALYHLDQINLLVCMLLSFPVGYFNRFVRGDKNRLYYGMITGMILQFQMYGISKSMFI